MNSSFYHEFGGLSRCVKYFPLGFTAVQLLIRFCVVYFYWIVILQILLFLASQVFADKSAVVIILIIEQYVFQSCSLLIRGIKNLVLGGMKYRKLDVVINLKLF